MIRLIAFVYLCLFTLLSCQSESTETVSLSEISPSSTTNLHVKKDKSTEAVLEKPTAPSLVQLSDSLFPDATWKALDTLLFPDRFGAEKSEKWIVKAVNDSLTFMQFQFTDSLRTKNAFFNWLDCFGAKCTSYKIGGNVKIKNRNSLFLVGNNQLILIESTKKIDEKEIVGAIEKDTLKQNWLYLVTMPRTGKSSWKKVTKGNIRNL